MELRSLLGTAGTGAAAAAQPPNLAKTAAAMGAEGKTGAPAAAQAAPQNTAGGDAAKLGAATARVMNDRFAQECQTCKHRKYQDGSNDPGVSFKAPTHVGPEASAAAVMAHEQEHVSRNRAAAEAEGGEVVSSAVVLHGAVCPECGRYYIAGGTTYTTTRSGGRPTPKNADAENGGLDITV